MKEEIALLKAQVALRDDEEVTASDGYSTAQDNARPASKRDVQVNGGYGYMMEFPAQRAWRGATPASALSAEAPRRS